LDDEPFFSFAAREGKTTDMKITSIGSITVKSQTDEKNSYAMLRHGNHAQDQYQ